MMIIHFSIRFLGACTSLILCVDHPFDGRDQPSAGFQVLALYKRPNFATDTGLSRFFHESQKPQTGGFNNGVERLNNRPGVLT